MKKKRVGQHFGFFILQAKTTAASSIAMIWLFEVGECKLLSIVSAFLQS